MPDDANKQTHLANRRAQKALDTLTQQPTGAARDQAIADLTAAKADLERLTGDTDAGNDARNALHNLVQAQNSLGIKLPKPDPAATPDGAKQAQTKSGASPTSPSVPGSGHPTPFSVPGLSGARVETEALNAARCKLCEVLRGLPAGGPTGNPQVDGENADKRSKAIADMILAEEEFLKAMALSDVPYNAADEASLDKGYTAVRDLAKTIPEIGAADKEVTELLKNLDGHRKAFEGSMGGVTGDLRGSDGVKLERKVYSEAAAKGASRSKGLGDRSLAKQVDEFKGAAGSKGFKQAMKAGKTLDAAGKTVGSMAKLTKPDLALAANLFAAGVFRMGYEVTQRKLIEVEHANSSRIADVHRAREAMSDAYGEVINRRQSAALDLVNEQLKKAGKPPFKVHTMKTETDSENYLDKRLEDLHVTDPIERNFGTDASKRTQFRPTKGVRKFRNEHGVPFGDNAGKALLAWCDQHCKKKAAAVPPPASSKKKIAVLTGGAAVALIALVGGVVATRGDGETATVITAEPAPVTEPAAVATDPPVTESAPASTIPESTAPASIAPASTLSPDRRVGIGSFCPNTTHSSPDSRPESLSWVAIDGVVYAVDPTTSRNGRLTLLTPGADEPTIEVLVSEGVFSAVMPISSMTTYEVTPAGFVSDGGPTELIAQDPFIVDVGPAEGPINGCTPPESVTDAEREAAAAALFPSVILDDGSSSGGDAIGGPAVIVDEEGAIPAPEDDLAPYREFMGRFDRAHAAGDADTLFDLLDPSIVDLYGPEQCQAHLDLVLGELGDSRVVDGRPDPGWEFVDGPTMLPIEGSWLLDVNTTLRDGEQATVQFHLRDSAEGVRWFTDCGEPVDR